MVVAMPQTILKADNMTASADQVVYDLPADAQARGYLRDGMLFRQWGADNIKRETLTSTHFTIAETPDGKVYIENALTSDRYGETKGYLVGTRTDNTVVFTFPQVLQWKDTYMTVMRLEDTIIQVPGYDPGTTYSRPSFKIFDGPQEVMFTIDNGTLIQESNQLIGFVNDDGKWNGYGEYELVFSPFDWSLVSVPEDSEAFRLSFAYSDKPLSARRKGNELYIQGLSTHYPDSWVKGTISGDRITFENGQYLGIGNYSIEFLCTGFDTPEFIPGYNTWEHHYTITPSMEMAYDESKGVISALDKNDCFILNSSQTAFAYGRVLTNPRFEIMPEEVDPKPLMPTFSIDENQWINGQDPYLTFKVRPYNIDGQPLDTDNIGFMIEVDGVPYVFTSELYYMDEDMTVIPWGFNNEFIEMDSDGNTRIFFQQPNLNALTIRTVHTVDGEDYYSDPQSPDNPVVQDPSSRTDSTVYVDSPVVAVRYYDLEGRVVSSPVRGFYIRQAVHENGSVTVNKIIL